MVGGRSRRTKLQICPGVVLIAADAPVRRMYACSTATETTGEPPPRRSKLDERAGVLTSETTQRLNKQKATR